MHIFKICKNCGLLEKNEFDNPKTIIYSCYLDEGHNESISGGYSAVEYYRTKEIKNINRRCNKSKYFIETRPKINTVQHYEIVLDIINKTDIYDIKRFKDIFWSCVFGFIGGIISRPIIDLTIHYLTLLYKLILFK